MVRHNIAEREAVTANDAIVTASSEPGPFISAVHVNRIERLALSPR